MFWSISCSPTYLAQVDSTIPLYFTNFVAGGTAKGGFSPRLISGLFTWHVAFAALCQLPIARALNRFSRPLALTISMLLWGAGFVLIWVTGVASTGHIIWAILALGSVSDRYCYLHPLCIFPCRRVSPRISQGCLPVASTLNVGRSVILLVPLWVVGC
jgi:hypothetical protein